MKLSVPATWAAILPLVCAASPLAAQQSGGGKIAYVNTQAILKATPEQRIAIVTKMASSEDETPGSRRRRRANPNTSIGGFYRTLKGATVRAYYTSKIGIHDDQHYKGNVYQQNEYAGFDPT